MWISLRRWSYTEVLECSASGAESETLWRLLGQYKILVFLFVNKMDQAGTDRERVLAELKRDLEITVFGVWK